MSEETTKIGKYDIPKNLLAEYVKFRALADAYALQNPKVTGGRLVPMSEYERAMRWQTCVQRVMELHREICKVINVPYSENLDDEFYKLFISETEKRVRSLDRS
jgi:bisphosphoglycerate-independent phosphoglycerate mutase (AlkP superfamily)